MFKIIGIEESQDVQEILNMDGTISCMIAGAFKLECKVKVDDINKWCYNPGDIFPVRKGNKTTEFTIMEIDSYYGALTLKQ